MFHTSAILQLLLLDAMYEEEEAIAATQKRKKKRRYLVNSYIDKGEKLPEKEFQEKFGITKEMFGEIMSLVGNSIPNESTIYSKEIQVLTVLNWLAHGYVEGVVEKEKPIDSSQNSVCKFMCTIIPILERILGNSFIQWPETQSQRKYIKKGFYTKFGIPSTLGIINCMLVEIREPEMSHLYLNQYDKYSLNVSLICDHEGKFISVDPTNGGATHNSEIWSASHERLFLERIYDQCGEKCWVLANKAYPLEPWLISPCRTFTQEDIEFNKKLSHLSFPMQRNVGVLKSHWKILGGTISCTPKEAARIVNICCALHNMGKMWQLQDVVIDANIQMLQNQEEIIEVDELDMNEEDEEKAEDLKDRGTANRELLRQILT